MEGLNYEGICCGARIYASHLNYSVDWRDLAHEAVIKRLRGKKYSDGAMKDFVTRRPIFGRLRSGYQHRYRFASMSAAQRSAAAPGFDEHIIMAGLRLRIETLGAEQRKVLILCYWRDLNREEIAAELGVTPSRISQIHTEAVLELRDWVLFGDQSTTAAGN